MLKLKIPFIQKESSIILHEVTEFLYVGGCQSDAAVGKYRLGGLSRCQLVFLVLLHRKVLRLTFFKLREDQVNGTLIVLVIILCLRVIDELQ